MSRERQHTDTRPGTASPERTPDIGELGADLPMSDELRAGLLEIAVGASYDRDGEARAAELESLVWSELEPSPALMQRLREIPARSPARRHAILAARPGTGMALAASYLLAVALTLVLGDPVAAGRRAATNLGATAGEHLLEPAAEVGASVQARVSRRLGALQGLWRPAGFFAEPLNLPTDRVRAWFQGAVDSSSETFRELAGQWPLSDSGSDGKPPPTTRNRSQTHQERSSA